MEKGARQLNNRPTGVRYFANIRVGQRVWNWVRRNGHLEDYSDFRDIASDMGVEPDQLTFYFTTVMHKRFATWRNELRLEEAKKLLLRHPNMPVAYIASMVGIYDPSDFRRDFIKYIGMSPKEWRHTHNCYERKSIFSKLIRRP